MATDDIPWAGPGGWGLWSCIWEVEMAVILVVVDHQVERRQREIGVYGVQSSQGRVGSIAVLNGVTFC